MEETDMEENEKTVVNHFEAGSNCQVFNGPITGCVFAMPGSNVTQAASEKQDSESDAELMNKIHIYFKDEDSASRFLEQIRALEGDETKIGLVRRYRDRKLCLNTSKALWQALYDMGLYGKSYANWNRLMNKI